MPASHRYIYQQILDDLARKMVFVAGPRQVGKTTLARSLPKANPGYLNWDIAEDREQILMRRLPSGDLWIFDEIHKYRQWRNYLKGIFDGRPGGQRILVAGSGRLEMYQFGGDSLQGRYHLHRLHPFSAAELGIERTSELEELLRLGGFPEPFLSSSEVEARRWSREYRARLIYEEVTSLERVQDLGHLESMVLRLPDLVGSPLSINALREDLQVSHKTASSWLMVLERLFVVFRLAPLGGPRIRAVKKEQKHYHFDWTTITEPGPAFENLVACHLLKWVHFQQDTQGLDLDLRYFRDTDGREVDFVVTNSGVPITLVECKASDREVSKPLRYLKSKYPEADAWQISLAGRREYQTSEGIRVAPALVMLSSLV